MKKLIAVSLVVALAFAVGRFSVQVPVEAQEGGDDPTPVCADANADGAFNISDPVYLLLSLFSGGPAPVCPEPRGVGLPDTSQKLCCDSEGNEVPCDGETCPGQDGFYSTGCSTEGRFVDNGDGTVTDNCTGLMWQKDTGNDGNRPNWGDALAHSENLELAGHDDWRLPNVRELQSIVDYGRDHPAIDPLFESRMSWYWSSSTLVVTPSDAWAVGFGYGGTVLEFEKTETYFVRAVRTIQPGE